MKPEQRITDNPWGLEPLLDIGELATYLGVPVSTIYDWRTRGLGPKAYWFGKHVKFAVSEVRSWVEQQRDSDHLPQREGEPMSRQRLTIGTFGDIGFRTSPSGRTVRVRGIAIGRGRVVSCKQPGTLKNRPRGH